MYLCTFVGVGVENNLTSDVMIKVVEWYTKTKSMNQFDKMNENY